MNEKLLFELVKSLDYDSPRSCGIATSTDDETREEWAKRWFGSDATYVGTFCNNGTFFYQYYEQAYLVSAKYLSGIVSVNNGGIKCEVYVYCLNNGAK